MPAFKPAHSSPYARLVANVTEEGNCWIGTEKSRGRGGYIQVNFRVPGLGGKIVKFSAHTLTWIAHHTGATSLDDLYLFYLELRESGLELDHECEEPRCRRPAHLSPMTHQENCLMKYRRPDLAPPPVVDEDWGAPLPF